MIDILQHYRVSATEDEASAANCRQCAPSQFVLPRIHQAAARSCGNIRSDSARTGRASRICGQIITNRRPFTSSRRFFAVPSSSTILYTAARS
ncbi:hypothetical protein AB0M45_14865 [Nocardia sp. NPDC051787]|uniref:hypothetical protein n=1 Tax=Nocardia sp. NPDC051787 TaxID=3155415 RepID=UPI003436A5CC